MLFLQLTLTRYVIVYKCILIDSYLLLCGNELCRRLTVCALLYTGIFCKAFSYEIMTYQSPLRGKTNAIYGSS